MGQEATDATLGVSRVFEGAADKGGLLEDLKLIKDTKIITNPDGSQSVVPVTDFFEKYSPLLKLGTVGASIAAAALGEDQNCRSLNKAQSALRDAQSHRQLHETYLAHNGFG